ncbi:PduM family microcompartment protein [Kosakonia sp. H02]|nr:PduM family microcompartment protein [Kosakonia sp. H02]
MTDAQIRHIVELIVARLAARSGNPVTLSQEQLRHATVLKLFLAHDRLSIAHTDLPFICQLAEGDSDNTAVANLFEALSLGMEVCVTLPVRSFAHLPLRDLARVPCRWCDAHGAAVRLHLKNVLSYRDIAGLRGGWLVTSRKTVITALAREAAQTQYIQLVKQE